MLSPIYFYKCHTPRSIRKYINKEVQIQREILTGRHKIVPALEPDPVPTAPPLPAPKRVVDVEEEITQVQKIPVDQVII